MRKLQNRPESGFTIIELLIVLAIAALIILIVLIAVPQLQRNQRNSARQSIAGRIATEVNNFAGNNNGNLPLATSGPANPNNFRGGANTFVGRYLTQIDVNDPQTGNNIAENTTFNTSGLPAANPAGSLNYRTNMICNGETATGTGANTRNFALVMQLEGGARYCLDNS